MLKIKYYDRYNTALTSTSGFFRSGLRFEIDEDSLTPEDRESIEYKAATVVKVHGEWDLLEDGGDDITWGEPIIVFHKFNITIMLEPVMENNELLTIVRMFTGHKSLVDKFSKDGYWDSVKIIEKLYEHIPEYLEIERVKELFKRALSHVKMIRRRGTINKNGISISYIKNFAETDIGPYTICYEINSTSMVGSEITYKYLIFDNTYDISNQLVFRNGAFPDAKRWKECEAYLENYLRMQEEQERLKNQQRHQTYLQNELDQIDSMYGGPTKIKK